MFPYAYTNIYSFTNSHILRINTKNFDKFPADFTMRLNTASGRKPQPANLHKLELDKSISKQPPLFSIRCDSVAYYNALALPIASIHCPYLAGQPDAECFADESISDIINSANEKPFNLSPQICHLKSVTATAFQQ